MLFNSFQFMFIFLPVALVGYFSLSSLLKFSSLSLVWLAGVSLAFYAYWDVRFLPIIVISICVNYAAGRVIDLSARKIYLKAALFGAAVALNLGALAYYKYMNFFIGIAGRVMHHNFISYSIVLPLGISFFTFTQIAYLADVCGGYKCERNIIKYSLFVSYFPHLIAGPILHHKEMMWQFGDEERKRMSAERVAVGLAAFTMGLFKKTVFADSLATLANPVFASAAAGIPHTADAWIGALAYSLQIYFDFSGYSDMALGLSTMFGITLPYNFDSPYKARNIVDFWRRWHITLSRFLRDYLYIPLGGNRHGRVRRYANLLVTMVLGGLWHGAGLTFVIWGALHGAFLILNHFWHTLRRRTPSLDRAAQAPLFGVAALVLTQLCVVVAWVWFRADSIRHANRILAGMFATRSSAAGMVFAHPAQVLIPVLLGYVWCLVLPNLNDLFGTRGLGLDTYKMPQTWSIVRFVWNPSVVWGTCLGVLTVVSLLAIIRSGAGTPFLYFQF